MHKELKKPLRPLLMLLVSGIALTGANASDYPAPEAAGPDSTYIFPSAFAPFGVGHIVDNVSVDARAPKIAEWTRSNHPGDTMAIAANDLSSYSGDAEGRDTRFIYYGEGALPAEGAIQRLDGMQVAVTLPSTLPADDLYLMWVRNSQGYGTPVPINRAEAWWVGCDRIAGGETFSVYGRNLALGNGKSYLYIEELNRWLASSSQNPYKADFVMPNDVANGTYTVWAHNGHGREFGWSRAKSLSVVSKVVWSGGTYNVKDYGAKGNGSSDDFDAISAAINAASSDAYSTVYFPAGTYRIAGRLPMKNKKRIRYLGAGMDQTVLTPHSNHASSSYSSYLIYNTSNESKFQDLTLAANRYGGNKLLYIRDQFLVECERVRFSQLDSTYLSTSLECVDLHKSSYVDFKDCEFILTGRLFLGSARQVWVDGCDFYGINDNNTIMSTWGGEEIAVVDSTGQSYDNSDPSSGFGWAKGRFFHSLGVWGSTHKVYFGGNRTRDMTPRNASGVDQNSGEQFMCEGENVSWRANASAGTGTSVTLPGAGTRIGDVVTIVAGRGFGQSREIVSTDSGVITVDEPWNVIPDAGSVVVVGDYTRRMVVYDNYLDGTPRAVDNSSHIAATGVQPYGGASSWIVAKNTFNELRHGVDQFARYKDNAGNTSQYVGCPHYFNVYKENRFSGCREGINIIVDKMARTSNGAIGDVSYMGVVYRDNVMTNTVVKVVQTAVNVDEGDVDLTIFDRNDIHTSNDGVLDDSGQKNYVWIGNRFTGGGGGIGMQISKGHVPALRENEWKNFASKYSGSTPGSVLELPRRTVRLSAGKTSADVDVYNGGTAPLNWTATSTADWVTIVQSGNVVDGQMDVATFTIEIDPAAVAASEAEAVVSVVSGAQVKQLTVVYDADASDPAPPTEPPAPVLTGIEISGSVSVDEGTEAQYLCTASYSDGTTLGVAPAWSENSSATTIDGSGLLTAGNVAADVDVTISASFGGKTDTHRIAVKYVPPVLTGLSIVGSSSVDEQTTEQYGCVGTFSDGTTAAVSPIWSENSPYATISASGLLNAGNVDAGKSVVVTASFGGFTASKAVAINYVAPYIAAIEISGPVDVDEASTAQYFCAAIYSDGSRETVNPSWSVSGSATIGASGVLSAGNVDADQGATITAGYGGKTDSFSLTIGHVELSVAAIAIAGPSSVAEGETAAYTCTATYSDGSSSVIDPVWSVDAAYASINASGALKVGNVEADGTVSVTATHSGLSKSIAVDVRMVGTQAIYPLSGFDGKTVKARLWNETDQTWHELGEMESPEELVVENVTAGQWYWVLIEEYDNDADGWETAHASWLSM